MSDKSTRLKMIFERLKAPDRTLPDTHGQERENSEAKEATSKGRCGGWAESLSVNN